MFENLLSDNDQNSIDVLMEFLKKDNIELKTDLEMSHIKGTLIFKWFKLRKVYPDKSPEELMDMWASYYMELKTSYKRQRESALMKGLSEMKDIMLENQMYNKKEK